MAKRYHRGNQNPFVEEEQTIQWPKEKVQKDKQRSTKHTHKTKDRVTRIRQKNGGEGVNSAASQRLENPYPLVAHVVLLLLTYLIYCTF